MVERKVQLTLHKEEGSGLVLALMVLLVLSVLGASLGVITIGSLQLSNVNHDSNSAYYIAEAGANLAYEEFTQIVKKTYDGPNGNTQESFYRAVTDGISGDNGVKFYSDIFGNQSGEKHQANVTIQKSTPELVKQSTNETETYLIESIGEVDGKTRTVNKKVVVKWREQSSKGGILVFPEEAALIIGGEPANKKNDVIKFLGSGLRLAGNLYIGNNKNLNLEKVKKDIEDNINLTDYDVLDYNDFGEFSNFENYAAAASDKHRELKIYKDKLEKNKVLEGDYKIGTLEFKNKSTLDIKNNNVTIYLKTLIIDETIVNVEGTGSLTIVVSKEVKFEDESIFNPDKRNVRIIVTNSSDITIEKESIVYAQLIGPYSKVLLENPSTFHGSIISKKIEIENKALLSYYPFTFDESGTEKGESTVSIEDLIEPAPAIEAD